MTMNDSLHQRRVVDVVIFMRLNPRTACQQCVDHRNMTLACGVRQRGSVILVRDIRIHTFEQKLSNEDNVPVI